MDLRHTCCTQWPDSKKTTRHPTSSSDLAVSWQPSLDCIAGSQQLLPPKHLELLSKLKHIDILNTLHTDQAMRPNLNGTRGRVPPDDLD